VRCGVGDFVAGGVESFHRVLTDPRDGAPLEIGRSSYRIPKALRQWLRLRDGKCPFPGCNNQSLDNEADHLLAWANGGATGISNLGQPCRKHHKLKHSTPWTPTAATKDEPPGWISPTGRHYTSEHPDWEPPTWPNHMEDPAFDAVVRTGQERTSQEWTGQKWTDPESITWPDQERTDQEIGAAQDGDAPPVDPLDEDPYPDWALLQTAEIHAVT
jgi:hypothetical protein